MIGRWSWGDERFYHIVKLPCAPDPFPWMIVITAVGQMALFLLYGAEIILFSLYFVPALVFIAAMAWQPGRYGRIILGAALLLLVVLAWNNGTVFMSAATTGETLIPVNVPASATP